jgi:peptidoglycan/LPS O-acetylase OafA/YrhL
MFARRVAPFRHLALVPALVALLFSGHAVEDDGPRAAAPFVAIILLSLSYVVIPTGAAWALLVAVFGAYGLLVASVPQNGPLDEWLFFMALGFVPALLMIVARPQGLRASSASERGAGL